MLKKIAAIMNMSEADIENHPRFFICAFDHLKRVTFWNKQCELLFGISAEELQGKKLTDLVPELEGNQKWAHVDTALTGQPVYVVNDKFERKDGYYDQVILPVRDDEGQITGALSIMFELSKTDKDERLHQIISLPPEAYL